MLRSLYRESFMRIGVLTSRHPSKGSELRRWVTGTLLRIIRSKWHTMSSQMKVLIDHSVRQHGIVGERGFVSAQGSLADQKYLYLQSQSRNKPQRADWLQPEIETLPNVAQLIRDGRLQAFTTNELYAEAFRVEKFPSPAYINIFEGCSINRASAPFERSKFGLGGEQFMNKDDVIAYCKSFFLTPTQNGIEKFIEGMKRNPRYDLSPFEEQCLRNAPVFQNLCRGIDESHYPDALHLWSAEENALDAFLTLDRKFRNVVERQNINFKCRIMYPTELVAMA